jgi:glycosyltransferase involved in cell wall biosynthesis
MEVAVLRGEGELTQDFRAAGIPVHLLRAGSRVDPLALERLLTLLRQRSYDLVHTHLFRADLYGAMAVAFLGKARPKLISTRHNDDRFYLHPFVGMVHFILSGRQDMIIAISDHVARFTIARGVRDVRRIRRVYHGYHSRDLAEWERERLRVRQELGLGVDDYVVGNVGRLAPQKGQRHLIGALPYLLERVPRANVVIAGAGDLEPYLRALADELGVAHHVHVLGPRRDIPAIMRAVDVFVMPSIWEGFGIVLLEAMAEARPIVASRVATIPEVVVDGENGVLVPPGDPMALAEALASLAADPERAGRLGNAGRVRLERLFSLEKMVADTEWLYEELLET